MLYHPYLLILSLLLFLFAAIEGHAVARGRKGREESLHRYAVYPAYALFLIGMALYYGFEREAITPEAREIFRRSGFLVFHVASISFSSLLLTLSFLLGLVKRKTLFEQGIGMAEAVHVALGATGTLFYLIAVLSGTKMYMEAGVL